MKSSLSVRVTILFALAAIPCLGACMSVPIDHVTEDVLPMPGFRQPASPATTDATLEAHGYAQPNLTIEIYVNGVLAGSAAGVGAYAASAASPTVGANSDASEPATDARILGVMYHEGAAPAAVTPGSFFIATREAGTLVAGLDTDATVSWQNIYTVQRGLSGRGIVPVGPNGPLPPTTWTPDIGLVPLARTGTNLTVRAHKNLDWHAALFAVEALV